MIIFDDNEFEIAIATYNRSNYVKEWLYHCYYAALERNILITIYDSSTNNETKNYIESFNKNKSKKVEYIHVNSSTLIGYKPMYPILSSNAKYLWVSGDSRYHNFDELDEILFSYIHNAEIDYASLAIVNNRENGGKIYTNCSEMIHDFFVSGTCIGLSIYRLSMFECLKYDNNYKVYLDNLFKDNYAFAWLGYFYCVFSRKQYKALFVNAKIYEITPRKKIQTWAKRFYGCWVDDLIDLTEKLPDDYERKELIPAEVWNTMHLDSIRYCYRARKNGDLNSIKYREIVQNNKLNKVTKKKFKIWFFANCPIIFLRPIYFVNMVLIYIYDAIFIRS